MLHTRQFTLGTLAAYMLLASQAVTAEITDNEIRIGNLADMTGAHRDPIGPLGEDAIRMAIEGMGGSVASADAVLFNTLQAVESAETDATQAVREQMAARSKGDDKKPSVELDGQSLAQLLYTLDAGKILKRHLRKELQA